MIEPEAICGTCQERLPMFAVFDHMRNLHPDVLEASGGNPLRANVVTEQDLEPGGMGCPECKHVFEVGDLLVYRTLDPGSDKPGLEGAAVVMPVCLDCGARGLADNPEERPG